MIFSVRLSISTTWSEIYEEDEIKKNRFFLGIGRERDSFEGSGGEKWKRNGGERIYGGEVSRRRQVFRGKCSETRDNVWDYDWTFSIKKLRGAVVP